MRKRVIVSLIIFSISLFVFMPMVYPQGGELELISLDIKGMDIRDVLKILSQKSGLNIVADKDVKGKVSLYLKDVEVMDALDILVMTNDLAYEKEGTLIRIMPERKYEKLHGKGFEDARRTKIVKLDYANADGVAKVVTKMRSKIGTVIPDAVSGTIILMDNPASLERMEGFIETIDIRLVTEIFPLDYAEAELVKDKIEKMLTDNLGSLRFDERTNKIVVRDTPDKMIDIKKVIEAFDEKTREVVIDANIIKVTLSDNHSYGIDWSDVAKLGGVKLTGDTNLTTSLTGTTPNTLTIATAANYRTVISLLDAFGETDVLSRPRLTVADGEEAKILVGAKEVYVTSEVTTASGGTYHTTDHVQFVDVGVRLTVTPEINSEGFIKMRIKPEVSDTDETKTVTLTNPDGSTRSVIPYVTTSEAETTILVKDNTTIILGGLMKDTITEYEDKVPFLGNIPLLGKLFSTHGKGKEKTELVIFLTPHIVEGDQVSEEAKFYKGKWDNYMRTERNDELDARIEDEFAEATERMDTYTETAAARETVINRSGYEDYYLALKAEIDRIAGTQDVSGKTGEVELEFTLDGEGFLMRGPVVLNKPDLELVRAAVNSVKAAVPFGSFPSSLGQDEAEFYVVVRYE